MRETRVDQLIVADLNRLPRCKWDKNQGNIYQSNGRPDYTAVWEGRHYEIEAKAGNGHPIGMAQLFNGYQVTQAGGYFVLAFADYQSLLGLQPRPFKMELHANKASQLSMDEYNLLDKLRAELNRNKQTVLFMRPGREP